MRIQRRHPTIARVALVYRFDPEHRGEPRVVRVFATLALAHEAGGWRVALPEQLSPRAAVRHDAELSVEQVHLHLRTYRREARRVRARDRNRRRATRTVTIGSTACPGSVRSAVDPSRDVTLADGGDLTRRQDDAGVDLVGASQSWTGGRVCFELRFRTPVAHEAAFDLWLLQRAPVRGHPVVFEAVRVEVSGDSAVATHEAVGHRWFPVDVRLAPARDSLAVEVRGARGWGIIEPTLRYRWAVSASSTLPGGVDAYLDELEP